MKLRLIFFNILIFSIFTDLKSDEIFNIGKEIFSNNGNCATCHSLQDAGSVADIGPNLDLIKPELERVKIAVTNGIGVMPSSLGILSEEEIEAVSYYVSESVKN